MYLYGTNYMLILNGILLSLRGLPPYTYSNGCISCSLEIFSREEVHLERPTFTNVDLLATAKATNSNKFPSSKCDIF